MQPDLPFPELVAVLGWINAMPDGRRVVVRPHHDGQQWVCQCEAPDGTVFSAYGPTTEDAALQHGRRLVTDQDGVSWHRVWLFPDMPWRPRGFGQRRPGHAAFYE